jgi:FtsP/CotA-like multicopper oxidase with cupredoxin domain
MRLACRLVGVLTGCSGQPLHTTSAESETEMVRAVDIDPDPHVIEVSLVAEPATIEYLDGTKTAVWAYRDAASNDAATVPGPFIEAEVGDRLIVHFENRLDDGTTIHFHGPRLPNEMDGAPMGESLIVPGGTFVYELDLLDPGTFWYHPHWHSDIQIERGLYGQLVVHDERIPDMRERFFMLDDLDLGPHGELLEELTPVDRLLGRHGEILVVNGRATPTISVANGSRERWHFTNASNGRYFDLQLPGHVFTVIGTDGGLIERAYETATLRIAPGKRYDLLVTPTGALDDEIALLTRPVDRGLQGGGAETRTVLTLRFDDDTTPSPPTGDGLPLGHLVPIPVDDSTPVQRFELGVDLDPFVGDDPVFSINEQAFPFADHVLGRVGAVVLWEIVNLPGSREPFHLHGTFMQALALDGVAVDGLAFEDVVDVPAGSTLRVAVRYERPGHWMFHSSIPEHAEAGMMRVLVLD